MQVDLIPGYRIQRKLGHGAFAQVYLAVQRSLDREIALKVMNPSMSTDKDLCERFIAEARVVASLRHRSIVSIHDVGKHEDNYYISMDLVGGSTLAEGIRRRQLPAPPLIVIRQIGEALGCAHQRGIVHRDVKPGNILIDLDGTAILTDFGIAKNLASDEQLTVVGSIIGTAAYMSPEQVSAQSDIDGRSDLYSLGIVLYEMLMGSPPFRGKDHFTTALMHLNQPIPRLPAEHRSHQSLLDRLLAKDRFDRFGSAEELVHFIDKITRSSESSDDAEEVDDGTLLRAEERKTRLIPEKSVQEEGVQRHESHDQGTSSSTREQRRTPDFQSESKPQEPASRSRRKSSHRLPLLFGAGVSVIAAVLVLGIVSQGWFGAGSTDELAGSDAFTLPDTNTSVASDARRSDATSRQRDPSYSPPDEETQRHIDNLLTAAKMHELVGRIAGPPGANAVEAYEDVLSLDPANVSAIEALERLDP